MLKVSILGHQTAWQWHPGLVVVSGPGFSNTLPGPFGGYLLFLEEFFLPLQLLEPALACLSSGNWSATGQPQFLHYCLTT